MTISQQNKQVYIINQVINVFNDFKNTLILFSKQKIKMICILYYWKVICQVIFCVHLVSLQLSKTVLYKWPTFIVLKVSHYSRMLYHFFLSLKSVDTIYLNNYKEKGMPVLSLSYGAFNLTFLAPKLKFQPGSYFNWEKISLSYAQWWYWIERWK